jgi:hypothetical protein
MQGVGVFPQIILKFRCSEMRFQANPDDIKSLVVTNFTAIIKGKNEKD